MLRRLRPDLVLVPLNTRPTGTLLVANLDPDPQGLAQALPQLEAELASPDPHTVPERRLTRADAVDSDLLLANAVWPRVVALREADAPGERSGAWAELADLPRLSAGEPADPDSSGEAAEPIGPAVR